MSPTARTLVFLLSLWQATPGPQPGADVIAQSRTIVEAILANDFASVEERYTADMKGALPPGRLATIWAALLSKTGAHKSCGSDPRVVVIGDKQMVITPCQFAHAAIDVQLAFDSTGKLSGLVFRPGPRAAIPYTLPSYAVASAFIERDITVGSGEWALPATLTLPTTAAPWPAIVLVHGSGPNDRDETVGANKPFRDLATGLASRGIAVLRYDKRTLVHVGKIVAEKRLATVKDEVIDDAMEAVRTLRAQPGIDGARVFVLGHSLGGMLIPRIAAADPTVTGLIVLAGPARPLEEAIATQTRYLAMADGTISPQEQQAIEQAAATGESVRGLTPADATSDRRIAGVPASYWLDLRGYDAPAAATQVKAPMLILQGERDYQVTVAEFDRWKAALGSRRDVTFHSYPALNHLFIAGAGAASPAEYLVAGHVSEQVVRDIADWILATGR